DRVAAEARADVEAGVRAPRRVVVVELTGVAVYAVDAVVAVADAGEIRTAVALRARPEEAVAQVVARRHVLDDDAFRAEHADAVLQPELTVEDDVVAIDAAERDVVRVRPLLRVSGDVDGLVVNAPGDQDEVTRLRRVDGGLNGLVVPRDFDRPSAARGAARLA